MHHRTPPFPVHLGVALAARLVPFAAVVVVVGATACAQKPSKPPKPATGEPVVQGEVGKELAAIVSAFDRDAGGFNGIVLVARDGRILLEQGYGMHDAGAKREVDTRSLWDWASVSKQFTAAAVLRLCDKKKLSLDDPLTKHWPKAPADKKAVTVRHLLNHTSGIQAGFRKEWTYDSRSRASLEELVLSLPLESEPGTKFEYSNSGYALAAALVEKVSGKPFEQFCIDELFEPAGMKDACFIGSDQLDLGRVPLIARGAGFTDRPKEFRFAYGNELSWGYRGCGGVVATARDMFAWDQALRGKKLLSAAAKQALYTVGKDDYALGWTVKRLPSGECAFHSGGVLGVVTMYYRLLDGDVVVALACNYEPTSSPARLAEELLARAAK